MKRTPILPTLLLMTAPALPALAQSDPTAGRSHLLPHIADGAGWQSTLIVTNVSDEASDCELEVNGQLMLDRFEDAGGVTVAGSTATFQLQAPRGYRVWRTRNGPSTVGGYATLDCTTDVTAQIVFAWFGGQDRPVGMATTFSSPSGTEFQLPVLTPAGTVGFAIANDHGVPAYCDVVLEDPQQAVLAEVMDLQVMPNTNNAQLLSDLLTIPATFESGSATMSCDQPVAVIGLHFELGDSGILTFNTLPPAILSAGEAAETDDMYTVLDGLTVAPGQVSLGGFALTFCLPVTDTPLLARISHRVY